MRNDKVHWKGVISWRSGSRGEVKSAFEISIAKDHLDDHYTLKFSNKSETTKQGLLEVGKLEPKIDSLPLFAFRWDEKDKRVDVDIYSYGNYRVSNTERKLFKSGKNGYSGHRAQPVNQGGRLFDIDISIPSKHIFKGHIHFNILVSEEV
jgi:hypothetical protein